MFTLIKLTLRGFESQLSVCKMLRSEKWFRIGVKWILMKVGDKMRKDDESNKGWRVWDAVVVKIYFTVSFIDELVLSMRLEIAGGNVNERKFWTVAGCVLEWVCESKGRFVKRQDCMGKQAYGAEGSKTLEGRLRTPLLHLVFRKSA